MAAAFTSKEGIALNLIYAWIKVPPRQVRSNDEWLEIAQRIPKLEAVHAYVNGVLKKWADVGYAPYQICYFQAEDRYPWFEDFPTSLSKSTVRTALVKAGLWDLMHGRNPLESLN